MNKAELVAAIAEKTELTKKEAEKLYGAAFCETEENIDNIDFTMFKHKRFNEERG